MNKVFYSHQVFTQRTPVAIYHRELRILSLSLSCFKVMVKVTLWSCFCGAPSLTRGQVCLLYMLLALASVVFLGFDSLGTRDNILLFQIFDFPFRRLLRPAGSRWRHSTPPPHGGTALVKVKVMLWRPVCLGVKHPSGTYDQILLLSDSCGFVDMGRSLWRENGSAVYNCCWSSPAQLFFGPSTTGLVTIFYSLRFETPPAWRTGSPYLYPPGTVRPSYTPRHWVPFSSPPTTRRATVEVFKPDSTRGPDLNATHLLTVLAEQSRAEQSRAVAYCRQPASTVTLGIEPRWDPWPYICSVSRLLFLFLSLFLLW
jgi:hypothetical protein